MNVPSSFLSFLRWAVVFAALFAAGDLPGYFPERAPRAAHDTVFVDTQVEADAAAARGEEEGPPSISEDAFDSETPSLGGALERSIRETAVFVLEVFFVEEEAQLTAASTTPWVRPHGCANRARAPPMTSSLG